VKIGEQTQSSDFLAKNPVGKVPVLETPEGFIFESNAIARFVARQDAHTHLLGANEYENGLVDQWLDFAMSEIELPAKVWLYPIYGFLEVHTQATQKAKGDILKVLEILNKHLEDSTFLVGERITLADIVVAMTMIGLFHKVLDPGFRKPFQNTVRWFSTIMNQPNVLAVVGEIALCTKMEVAKPSQTAEKKEKEVKPKEEKPKKQPAEQKPKEEKKPKKKEEEEEEEEESYDDTPKTKNPLDLLPKSPFDIENWKRVYSNKDGKESIQWFWENFDKVGWSLWRCDYKYNSELESILKTCNLIGGWFQRLDRLRKYGFGNALIFNNEEKNHFEITAVWLVRGLELPFEMLDCVDTELYEWTKLDSDSAEVKAQVQEFWNWEGQFGGRKFEQGKLYK